MIEAVFFDVANTLLHKPVLFERMAETLVKHGYKVTGEQLRYVHKIVSEAVTFPDTTSKDFYLGFNESFLYALGIAPSPELLNDLFNASTYLEWEPFADAVSLDKIKLPMGILSNWDLSLKNKLDTHLPFRFSWILGSQASGLRKPDPRFFSQMIEASGLSAHNILFVGDSPKLDVHPALNIGARAVLIDRYEYYPNAGFPRIKQLSEVCDLL